MKRFFTVDDGGDDFTIVALAMLPRPRKRRGAEPAAQLSMWQEAA